MRTKRPLKLTKNFLNVKAQILKEFNVTESDIKSQTRKATVVKARDLVANILRMEKHSFYQIGSYINRDHATVIHCTRKHKQLMKLDVYKKLYVIFQQCHEENRKISNRTSTIKMIEWHRKQADKLEKSLK